MTDKPTHLHKPSGALVFADGYKPSELKPLPEGYWAEQEAAQAVADLRAKRDDLLAQSDAMMGIDRLRTMPPDRRRALFAYRAALRDLPSSTDDPLKPKWPELP